LQGSADLLGPAFYLSVLHLCTSGFELLTLCHKHTIYDLITGTHLTVEIHAVFDFTIHSISGLATIIEQQKLF